MKKRIIKLVSLGLVLTMVLAGCAGGKEEIPSTPDKPASESSEEGVSITFAQVALTDEESNDYYQSLIDDYNEITGNKVLFETVPEDQFRTWLMTQFTVGNGPDVYTSILYDAVTDYGKGWLYNFADEVKEESNYFEGKTWEETISTILMDRMYLSENEVAGVPSTTTVVRMYYNKNMFEEAGITDIPETWEEYIEVLEKIQAIGKTPLAFPNASIADLSWLWFNNSIVNQINHGLVGQLDVTGDGFVELNEMAKGVDENIIDFTQPGFADSFKLMKDFSEYWTGDYNALDQKTAIQMFLREDVAMVQTGSWNLKMIDEIEDRGFEFGVFPVPTITTTTHPDALGQSVVLGGQPDGIMCVNSDLEGEKLAVAIDFAQYMTSPEVQAKKAEAVYQMPSSVDAKLPEKLQGFVIIEDDLRVPYFTGVNEEARNYFHRGGQDYLEGSITLEEYGQMINDAYANIFDTIKQENGWTKENNYKITE